MPISRRSRLVRRLLLPATLALLAACAGRPVPVAPLAPPGELDPGDRRWVERTLASLTVRDKVGQMVMPWISGAYVSARSADFDTLAAMVMREGVGGLVISNGLPLEYAAKLNALQQRARVPLLVASDMESGPGMRLGGAYVLPYMIAQGGGTDFPPAMALGAADSDSLAWATGRVLAAEARAVGVQMAFGPVLDVNSNPANPIINIRSFGEDAGMVARLAGAFARGARAGGLETTAKHFPGHGDVETDSHLDLPATHLTRARLDSVELLPYRETLPSGMDGVMAAHIASLGVEGNDAPPATLSSYFLTRVLREELGFRGLVFTDAMDMGAIVRHYGATDALVRAVRAGADVLLMPGDLRESVDTLAAAVRDGRIPEARIDASVRRILAAKARAGLPRARLVPLAGVDTLVGTRAHRALAQEVAARSITLARDEGERVPLSLTARRLLVLTYAAPTDLAAGWTFADGLRDDAHMVDTVRVDPHTTAGELAALGPRVDSADVVIAATFVTPGVRDGALAAHGAFAAFVDGLAAAGKPVVAVSFGSPYVLQAYPSVGSYLLAWGGAEVCQQAAADALLGREPITGRLPVSIPPFHARGEGLMRPVRTAEADQ